MISFAPLRLLPLLAAAAVVRAETHYVQVGGTTSDGKPLLAYTPPTVAANIGDMVSFVFHVKNHTATQSSFPSPCSPMLGGFDSGFMPVSNTTTSGFPSFSILVNDTKPVWVYCRQTGHCPSGMVFAVNPPSMGNTFAEFQAEAIASGNSSGTATATASASVAVYSDSSTTIWDSTPAYTPPPSPIVTTVTETVTVGDSAYTTTYASWEGSHPDTTSSALPVTHSIFVGGSFGLVYSPPTVTAAVGDVVLFTYGAKNHTVTQSSFTSPCDKLVSGFDSGFTHAVSANGTVSATTFSVTVNDTNPIWFYCRQTGHCEMGMVGAINPPAYGPHDFDAFRQLALSSNGTTSSPSGSSGYSGSSSYSASSDSWQNAVTSSPPGSAPTQGGTAAASGPSGTAGVAGANKNGGARVVVSLGLCMGVTALAVAALL